MNLELDRSAYGFVFNYHHALDRLVKGSFIKINLPIVRVDHKILSCIKGSALTLGGASNFFSENNVTTALQNYFSGHVVELEDSNQMTTVLQAPLCNALIPSKNVECSSKKQQRRSSVSKGETGVADIDVQVGYHCIYKPNYHASLVLSATFPTGNKPDMRRIWSPVVGNGQQWGLGFNGYMDGKIFGCYDEHLYVILGVSYRYLFQTEQCRTLGLCGYQWGHYQLLGQKNQDLLIPAANKLLQRVKIIGGSQVEGILQFNYTNHGFGIDLGYNIFFKEEEEIKLKRGHEVFEPNTYAIAARDYINTQSGGHAFGSAAADFASAQFDDYLTNNNVDLSVAQTPTLITHKIYGGFSYLWKKWNIPVLIGLGGQYEWGNAHEVFENWGITLKTGVSF